MRNGRITASPDATVRLVEPLNVSLDYLAIDDVPPRTLHVEDYALGASGGPGGARRGRLGEPSAGPRHFLIRRQLRAIAGGEG